MGLPAFPIRVTEPETVAEFVKFTGVTGGPASKAFGSAVTVTWISTGVYDIAFSENPGAYLGTVWGFEATTQSATKGFTIVAGNYNTTTFKLRINITNASETLVDLLTSNQWAVLFIMFRRGAVSG